MGKKLLLTAFSCFATGIVTPVTSFFVSCSNIDPHPEPEPTKDWEITPTNGWRLDYVYDDGIHKREYAPFNFDLIRFVGTENVTFEITSQEKGGVEGQYICFDNHQTNKQFSLELGQKQLSVPIALVDSSKLIEKSVIKFSLTATIRWHDTDYSTFKFENMYLVVARPTTEDMFNYNKTKNGVELLGFKNDEETIMRLSFCSILVIPNDVTSIANNAFFQDHASTITNNFEYLVLDDFWGYKESKLTSIGDSAFRNAPFTTEIYFPDSIQEIGVYAFQNVKFSGQLVLPSHLLEIGDSAFENCDQFTGELLIPNSIQSIGIKSFSECAGFDALRFNRDVLDIEYNAFDGCSNIQHLDFSNFRYEPPWLFNSLSHIFNNFKSIGVAYVPLHLDLWKDKLVNCCLLPKTWRIVSPDVNPIPYDFLQISEDGKTLLGIKPGVNLHQYESLVVPTGIETIQNNAFDHVFSSKNAPIKNINLFSGSLTKIGTNAFKDCSMIEGLVDIPEGTTQIGDSCFEGCTKITEVRIPKTLVLGETEVFKNCSSLGRVDLSAIKYMPDWLLANDNNNFEGVAPYGTMLIDKSFDKETWWDIFHTKGKIPYLWNVWYEGKVVPSSCFELQQSGTLLSGIRDLDIVKECNTLVIPSTVKKISANVFNNSIFKSSKLTNLSLSGCQLIEIGDNCFKGCSNFKGRLRLPRSITRIGAHAFDGCSGLDHELIIPSSCEEINSEAFNGCSSFTEIDLSAFNNTLPIWAQPHEQEGQWLKIFSNLAYSGLITVANSLSNNDILTWKEGLYSNCALSKNWNVESKDKILPLKYYKFDETGKILKGLNTDLEMEKYNTIKIPDEVEVIDSHCFVTLGAYMKDVCTLDLFNGSLHSIKDEAFCQCNFLDLMNFNIPNTVSSIGDKTFYECKIKSSITIPSSVTTIGKSAFARALFANYSSGIFQNYIDMSEFVTIPDWWRKSQSDILYFDETIPKGFRGTIYLNAKIIEGDVEQQILKEVKQLLFSRDYLGANEKHWTLTWK